MADMALVEVNYFTSRATKRKRVRRLLECPPEGAKRSRHDFPIPQKVERCSQRAFVTCLLISVALTILLSNYYAVSRHHHPSDFFSNFISNYQKHYLSIFHGKQSFCVDKLDTEALANNIRQEQTILNQNSALLALQSAMQYDRPLISVAIVGPVGVGKNLYANALQKYFPWPENVKSYNWNTFVGHENEKYRSIRMLIEHFMDCGINLLIIRNISPSKKHIIDMVTQTIKEQPNSRKKRAIVVYIFNLNTMSSEAEYQAQFDSLQNLNNTKTINFKAFGRKELIDCIQQESKLENMVLSQSAFQQLLETIDVKRSGCKNVNAKILTFGKKSNNN